MSKVTAYMATFAGREIPLADAVMSLSAQVDTLHLWVNDYPMDKRAELEKMLSRFKNVVITYSDVNGSDIGDIGKFWYIDEWDGYIITVDDTWIYPPDYVEKMLQCVDAYDRKAVVTAHGRIVSGKVKSYYYWKGSNVFLYNDVPACVPCNEIGTGVMALHSDTLKGSGIGLEVFEYTNMTDIYFSIALQKAGIPCVVAAHSGKWIAQNPKSTRLPRISVSCARNEKLQVDTINAHNWTLITP